MTSPVLPIARTASSDHPTQDRASSGALAQGPDRTARTDEALPFQALLDASLARAMAASETLAQPTLAPAPLSGERLDAWSATQKNTPANPGQVLLALEASRTYVTQTRRP